MSFKESCVVYCKEKNMAYALREKCKNFGLNPSYINDINELFKYLIKEKAELVITDETLEFYDDVFKVFLNKVNKNCFVIYVSDNEAFEVYGDNFYSCKLDNLEPLISVLSEKKKSCPDFTNKIPEELVYKYTTEALLEFKLSPTLQGYSYLKQCVLIGMKYESNHINFTKDLYREVANNNNTTISNIEKSIRSAIKKTMQLYPQAFKKVELENNKITNATLITYLIINVKLRFIDNNYDKE